MNLRIVNDRVLVVLPEHPAERQTTAGLFLAHSLTPALCYGRVARVGPNVRDVAQGDAVAFPPNVGDGISIGEHDCLFVRESEIVAVIPKREAVSA